MQLKRNGRFVLVCLFLFFVIFIAAVLFLVLYASGFIVFNDNNVLSVTSFSCTSSGVYISLHKNSLQQINITGMDLYEGSNVIANIPLVYSFSTENANVFISTYKCLVSGNYSLKVYYSTYSLFSHSAENTNNFFSKLISDTNA